MSDQHLFVDQEVGEKLASKGVWLYIFTIIILPTGYITRMMISQTLSVEDVGLLYTILGFITMIAGYNDLGLTGALVYYIPNLWIEKAKGKIIGLLSIASLAQILTSILISLGLRFGGERIANNYFNNPNAAPLLHRFVLFFVGINITQVISVVFKSFQDVIKEKALEAIRARGILFFSSRLFRFADAPSILDFGTSRVVGMLLTVTVGSLLFIIYYSRSLWTKPTWDMSLIRSFGHYALYSFIGMNARLLLGQLDQQMVNFFIGNEMAGYYTNFLSLSFLATLILSPLGGYMYPLFSELFAKNDQTSLRKIIELYYHELLLILFAVCVYLIVFGPSIALFLFGDGWGFSGTLLRRYAPFAGLTLINGLHLSLLGANGQPKVNAQVGGIGLLVNLIVNFIGLYRWGVWGILAGLIISNLVMCVISFRKARSTINWNIYGNFWLKSMGILLFLASILVGITYLPLSSLTGLIIGALVSAVIIISFYWKKGVMLIQMVKGMKSTSTQ